MITIRLLVTALTGLTFASTVSLAAPVLRLTSDDTVITQSCIVEIAGPIADANGNGVLHIRADGVTVRFKRKARLCAEPRLELRGTNCAASVFASTARRNVTLKGLRVHGFKNGVVASNADGLIVDGGDYSDNYRQQLKSTPEAENGADWLVPAQQRRNEVA